MVFSFFFLKKWPILTDDKIPFDNDISTHLICQDQESAITNMDGFVICLAVRMLSGSERKTNTNNLTWTRKMHIFPTFFLSAA